MQFKKCGTIVKMHHYSGHNLPLYQCMDPSRIIHASFEMNCAGIRMYQGISSALIRLTASSSLESEVAYESLSQPLA